MGKQKQKRNALEKRDGIQAVLEGYRRFDYEYISTGDKWTVPDAKYRYRQKFPDTLITGFWRTTIQIAAPVAIKLIYGAKVTGKENLKALQGNGALCVCNHFSYLDTLFVRAAVGHYRSFHTMTQRNNKTGIGGHIIRHGGMLPFSENYTAMKNLVAEMDRLLKKGKIINFYAEKAMWINYQKPRPMKEGAFTYAVKYDVPVLPIFCTFEKNAKGHIRNLRINILPPVYPEPTLGRRERAAAMCAAAESEWKDCYEKAYGIPLEYLPDRRTAPKSEK